MILEKYFSDFKMILSDFKMIFNDFRMIFDFDQDDFRKILE